MDKSHTFNVVKSEILDFAAHTAMNKGLAGFNEIQTTIVSPGEELLGLITLEKNYKDAPRLMDYEMEDTETFISEEESYYQHWEELDELVRIFITSMQTSDLISISAINGTNHLHIIYTQILK